MFLRIILYTEKRHLNISCLISQNLNALLIDLIILLRTTMGEKLTSYFLICFYGSWHISLEHEAV